MDDFPSTALTVELWVRSTMTPNVHEARTLAELRDCTETLPTCVQVRALDEKNRRRTQFILSSTMAMLLVDGKDRSGVLDGIWHHVAVSWQSADGMALDFTKMGPRHSVCDVPHRNHPQRWV